MIKPQNNFLVKIHDLSDRIQNNSHNDALWAQGKNGWTQELPQERENLRKYKIEAIELKNTITELKTILKGLNSRWDETEGSVELIRAAKRIKGKIA